MILYNKSLSILEEVGSSKRVSSEDIPLNESVGRILATSILSPEDVPSFANSAMDGFAVFASETRGAGPGYPVEIPVHGIIAAGNVQKFNARLGSCVEIMTGAAIPPGESNGGYDSVIRIEDAWVERSTEGVAQSIKIFSPSKPGDNIRLKGTDYSIGQVILKEGTRMAPEHILACASLGITSLRVKCRPRVVIVSTGSELVPPESPSLIPGMIRNSTGPFLCAALSQFGVDVHHMGIVSDDPDVYRKTLERALADGAEIVISTGAVSMGQFDFVPEVLKSMGAITCFHKAAIRPGKPIFFSDLGASNRRSVFFGLPGNPVSTAVGLRFFVEPYLRSILGLEREKPVQARLFSDYRKPEGLRCFLKGRTKIDLNGAYVDALKGQSSYIVSALLEANAWIVLPEEGSVVSFNSVVDIYPLRNAFDQGVMK